MGIPYYQFKKINMPRFNGMGPNGQGPMTGRGYGSCNTPNRCCTGFYPNRRRFMSEQDEVSYLENERQALEEELKAINEEIENIKKDS